MHPNHPYRQKLRILYIIPPRDHLQVLLRRTAPPLLIYKVCAYNHDLHRKRNGQQTHPTQAMLLHNRLDHIRNILVIVLNPAMHGRNQLLVILAFQIAQDLLNRVLRALAQAYVVCAAVVDGGESRHELVVAVLGELVDGFDRRVDGGDVVRDVLDPVVQVFEAIVIRFHVAGQDVLDPWRN